MADWGDVLEELKRSAAKKKGRPDFDLVRRKYLVELSQHTGRATILYAAKFTQPHLGPGIADFMSIQDGDLQGVMTVVHGLAGPNLDLIIHSPGGSASAAESFVTYLRSKYKHIRVIIPHLAMSAATMIACAGDELVMGEHSFLGPIDPQFVINTPTGRMMVPALAILEQFDLAKMECQDPKKLAAWAPMLGQYGPGLLVECRHASDLSEQLVRTWLRKFMFKARKNKAKESRAIAKWLSFHRHWKTHTRQIPRHELEKRGLRIVRIEQDPVLQDLALSVFHATTHTFAGTSAVKIIENNLGKAFIQQLQLVVPEKPTKTTDKPAGGQMPATRRTRQPGAVRRATKKTRKTERKRKLAEKGSKGAR